jgi:hypothetical protein
MSTVVILIFTSITMIGTIWTISRSVHGIILTVWTFTNIWISSWSNTRNTIFWGIDTGFTVIGTWNTFSFLFDITRFTSTVWGNSVRFTNYTSILVTFSTFIVSWLTSLTINMNLIIEETNWTVGTIWNVNSRISTNDTVISFVITF